MSSSKATQTSMILEALREKGEMSPTQIGVALGYSYEVASSRVAKSLKFLTTSGEIARKQIAHNRVTYSLRA